MFTDPDINTRNHKFWIIDDYKWKSRTATEIELSEARKDLLNGLKSGKYELMVIGRSCWVCNGAHVYLIDMDAMNCFSCGRIYHHGIDVMEYEEEDIQKG